MIYQSLTKEIPHEKITEILGIDFSQRDFFLSIKDWLHKLLYLFFYIITKLNI